MHTKRENSRFQPCLRTISQEQMRINPKARSSIHTDTGSAGASQSISHSRDAGDPQARRQVEKLSRSPQTKH